MRPLAVLVSIPLLMGAIPLPEQPKVMREDVSFEVSTITVTAPRLPTETEIRVLKYARASGVGAGVAGAGLMAYVIAFDVAGPFGWAASLIFLGGMSAYLSHRRLKGLNDFPPVPVKSAAPTSEVPAAHLDKQ